MKVLYIIDILSDINLITSIFSLELLVFILAQAPVSNPTRNWDLQHIFLERIKTNARQQQYNLLVHADNLPLDNSVLDTPKSEPIFAKFKEP